MHGMTVYFIRRILLIPITFVCITFVFYCILRLTPGGPIEQAQLQIKMARMQGEGGGGGGADTSDQEVGLSEKEMTELKRYYRLDRDIHVGYMIWLGVWPVDEETGFDGILQGEFGISFTQGAPVLDVITGKFYISLYFGLIGYFASWIICVPLGVFKGIHHKSLFDLATSVLVFLGYSIPGFVACLILLMLLGGGSFLDLVPMGDFRSPAHVWDSLSWWGKVKDQLHHTAVPVCGYLVGAFATMTILMKNSLLENFGADYVRTAFAKGLTEKRVIFVHALRNSLIPITAGIGHALGLLFAGSFLIEVTCNIPGMGLLGFQSIQNRDYPILLGLLVFGAVIRLTGNIFSDLVWATIDPRIRFGGAGR